MNTKLYDSELKVMDVLWRKGNLSAGHIAKFLKEEIGWNRNTTYTVIKKCIEKGTIERIEPNFICKAVISREMAQKYETSELIEKMYDGSKLNFFASFINEKNLSVNEIEMLKQIVNKLK
jgi:predicted transcriptional regulator